jgi:hypothetical protein
MSSGKVEEEMDRFMINVIGIFKKNLLHPE